MLQICLIFVLVMFIWGVFLKIFIMKISKHTQKEKIHAHNHLLIASFNNHHILPDLFHLPSPSAFSWWLFYLSLEYFKEIPNIMSFHLSKLPHVSP